MISDPILRMIVISDQAIFLRGLVNIIQSMEEFSLLGQGQNLAEAVQLCQICKPDIVFLSMKNPPELFPQVIKQIHQQNPGVIFICMACDPSMSITIDHSSLLPIHFFNWDLGELEFKNALTQIHQNCIQECDLNEKAPKWFGHDYSGAEELTINEFEMDSYDPLSSPEIQNRELLMAGRIQKDILPEEVPRLPGWEISARLEPARETSGDFYDFIPLTEHKLGIVIADVIDKGMGAALFMALSSSLIRTYAARFPTLPALTLNAVSNRILSDTRGGMFVTALFCVLEPLTGRVICANAGHPPGFLIHAHKNKVEIEHLRPTGMALGVSEQAHWKQKIFRLNVDDLLVLYTDGVTEAESEKEGFFGEKRILDVILSHRSCHPKKIQEALLEAVFQFSGNAPHQDDIAIIVIRRTR
jgi:serine phosphatase RsbU (regulator of sigma subunit)